jgi:hypothetical protein
MRAFNPTAPQRRCLIDATIDPLKPFPRGFAHSKHGPFHDVRTVHALVTVGALRVVKERAGNHTLCVTARAG